MSDADWKPILTIWPWEIWGRTDQFWIMITRDRVVWWEWKRSPKLPSPHTEKEG